MFQTICLKGYTIISIIVMTIMTASAQTNDKMILKSLSAAYEVQEVGMYKFFLAENIFEAYVDSIGYVLLINDHGGGQGVLKQMEKLPVGDRGILSEDIVKQLGPIVEILIVTQSGDSAVSMSVSTPEIIKRLKNYKSLHTGKADNVLHQSWKGNGAMAVQAGAYCTTKFGNTLDSNIIDVCGNTKGMKWSPVDNAQQLIFSQGNIPNGQKIQLWVRGLKLAGGKAKEDIEYLNNIQSVHHDKVLKSLKDAAKVTAPGIYQFNIKGNKFSTVVDEQGYVLLAKDNNAYKGPLQRVSALDDTIRGILAPDFIKKIKGIHKVRITNKDLSFDVNSYSENVIIRLTKYHDLSDYYLEEKRTMMKYIWDGSNKEGVNEMPFCGNDRPIYSLDSAIYDACFTKNAMVWSPLKDKKTIKFKAKKNESELNLWVASKNSYNKISKTDKKVKHKNEHRNQVLSLKLGIGFSDGLPVELGLSKVVPYPVNFWGGEEPFGSTSLGLTYMRKTLDNQSFYHGFNFDAHANGVLINARLRWTSAFDNQSKSAHYVTPALGVGLMELFQVNFNYRIPIKENNLKLNKFYVSLSAEIPLFGGRFD